MLPFGWIGRVLAHVAAGTVLAGVAVTPAAPPAAPPVSCHTPGPPRSRGGLVFELTAMTVTSGCNAWAVGSDGVGPGREVIERWHGTRWAIQHTPVRKGELDGVSALSPTDVWADGESGGDAVFEHWNGRAWRRVPSPLWSQASMGEVTAISPTDVWAVGKISRPGPGAPSRTLIVHWDGRRWRRVASPDPGSVGNDLWGVTATSAADVWAVGCVSGTGNDHTFTVHWDGRRWRQVPSPDPPPNALMDCLVSVSATSYDDVWAVGSLGNSGHVVTMHWDGRRWRLVPNPGMGVQQVPCLDGVVAVSPTLAWAIGSYGSRQGGMLTLAERWNGTAWQVVKTASPGGPGGDSEFRAVAQAPAGAAWALGFYARTALSQRLYPFLARLP